MAVRLQSGCDITDSESEKALKETLMLTRHTATVGLCLLLAPGVIAQDATRTVVATVSKAMGADALRTLEYSGSGYDFAFGQAYAPGEVWPKFNVKSYTRALDFQRPASIATRVRTQFENPPRGGGLQPINGEQTQTQTILDDSNTPWSQQLEIWMTPHGFLKAAATRSATSRAQTISGKRYSVLTFTGDNKAPVNGYINDQNLVERVETRIDSPMLGDMPLEFVYSDYKDFNGVKFPTHIVQSQGGAAILDLSITDVKPNATVTIPAPAAGGSPAAGAPPASGANLPTEKVADGVYLILGSGAISVAFDFKDYVVVMEAPASEARGEAVIEETKRLIPNKPIRYVINTHHHFDHSSGLRPFVAEGATIVTHQVNKAYYEKVLAAPRTLSPDRLQQAKKKVLVDAVDDKKVLTDGTQVIELYHMRENRHNAGILIAYLPKQKFLIQADMMGGPTANGPPPVSVYGENFLANVARLKLDVNRMIPIHYPADGKPILWPELMRSLGRTY
jgi:glyoxylase-like metal-dependent hydrolase (beta-lactamase superfamily II)